jgi:hypothetical protein
MIEKVREKDALCGKGACKCIPYLARTLEFKNMYLLANNVKEKREVMSTIYMTLKQEGFRFLEVMGEGGWMKKTYEYGKAYVGKRTIRVCSEKEGDVMTQTMTALVEAAPGPFERKLLPGNGIVNCQGDEPKGH